MASRSSIEWTEATWNPATGCTKVSSGCRHCYAERLAVRLRGMRNPSYSAGFEVALHHRLLDLPLRWRRPRMIFVNSMGDLFHEDVPDAFIMQVFGVMAEAAQHTFQVLTKRSERLAHLGPVLRWGANIWMGVTVEEDKYRYRAAHLRSVPSRISFLSLEPLLGPIPELDLRGIDWVIVGGESGPGARPMRREWAADIRDQCVASGVPFFFKQWGGVRRNDGGLVLDGRRWEGMPVCAAE
jgi:protein gp37